VQLDDTLLLIEAEGAKQYEEKLLASLTQNAGSVSGVSSASKITPGGKTLFDPPVAGVDAIPRSTSGKAKSFYGSVEVNPATAKIRLVQLVEEVINNLASDPQGDLKISVEINADFPNGASDQIKRTVSENAKSLGFKTWTWE
jgi:uncharacterized protein